MFVVFLVRVACVPLAGLCFVPKMWVLFQIVQYAWNNIKSCYVYVFISFILFIYYIVPMFHLFQELYYEGQIYLGD